MARLKRLSALALLTLAAAFMLFVGHTASASACGTISYENDQSPVPDDCSSTPDKAAAAGAGGAAVAGVGCAAAKKAREGKAATNDAQSGAAPPDPAPDNPPKKTVGPKTPAEWQAKIDEAHARRYGVPLDPSLHGPAAGGTKNAPPDFRERTDKTEKHEAFEKVTDGIEPLSRTGQVAVTVVNDGHSPVPISSADHLTAGITALAMIVMSVHARVSQRPRATRRSGAAGQGQAATSKDARTLPAGKNSDTP